MTDQIPTEIDSRGDFSGICAAVHSMAAMPGVQGVLLLVAHPDGLPEALDAWLPTLSVPVFGGLFPALVADGAILERGAIAVGLPVCPRLVVVPQIDDPEHPAGALLAQVLHGDDAQPIPTTMVWIDGRAGHIDTLLDALFLEIGLQGNFLGGGTGRLDSRGPSLITPSGRLQDAAVIALLDISSGVGMAHGWQAVGNPFLVTRAQGNRIQAIEGQPAAKVYIQALAEQGVTCSDDTFGEIARSWPLGLGRWDDTFVVRDPVAMTPEGVLICVGEVPEGALLHLLHGSPESLLGSAGQARAGLLQSLSQPPDLELLFDCISRVQVLGPAIREELQGVRSVGCAQVGAFTLGEIANNGREFLEFHNKTLVLAGLRGS